MPSPLISENLESHLKVLTSSSCPKVRAHALANTLDAYIPILVQNPPYSPNARQALIHAAAHLRAHAQFLEPESSE